MHLIELVEATCADHTVNHRQSLFRFLEVLRLKIKHFFLQQVVRRFKLNISLTSKLSRIREILSSKFFFTISFIFRIVEDLLTTLDWTNDLNLWFHLALHKVGYRVIKECTQLHSLDLMLTRKNRAILFEFRYLRLDKYLRSWSFFFVFLEVVRYFFPTHF